ncbi:MAG: cytochrome c [Anaerolineae bacterium]
MKKTLFILLFLTLMVMALVISGCGPAAPPTAALEVKGDPAKGKAIYEANQCNACHMTDGQGGNVGPDMTHIGTVAATRKAGVSVAEYLHESILTPDAFVVPDCPQGPCQRGIMSKDIAQKLSDEDLDDLIAYLASLE